MNKSSRFLTRERIGDYILSVKWDDITERFNFHINGNFYAFHYNEVETMLFVEHVRNLLRELTAQQHETE